MNTQKQAGFTVQSTAKAFGVTACAIAIAASISLFASCSQTPLYATIETEEPLKSASIVNNINSLLTATYDGAKKVYTSNGYVWRKDVAASSWDKLSNPENTTCLKLATDAIDGTGSLYALFVTLDDESPVYSVRKWSGSAWVTLDNSSSIVMIGSGKGWIYGFADDGTVSSSSSHLYNVFVAKDGTQFGTTAIITGAYNPLNGETSAGRYVGSYGYSYGKSKIWYYDGTTATVVSSSDIESSVLNTITCDTYDYAYAVAGVYVYELTSAGVVTTITHSLGTTVQSRPTGISILDTDGGTDYILISGSTGYRQVPGDVKTHTWGSSAEPDTSLVTNYTSSLDLYYVPSIWGVLNGSGYTLFANVEQTTKGGLWSYTYSASGSSWNRE